MRLQGSLFSPLLSSQILKCGRANGGYLDLAYNLFLRIKTKRLPQSPTIQGSQFL